MGKRHQGERIVLASNNAGKVREIGQLLAQLGQIKRPEEYEQNTGRRTPLSDEVEQ